MTDRLIVRGGYRYNKKNVHVQMYVLQNMKNLACLTIFFFPWHTCMFLIIVPGNI